MAKSVVILSSVAAKNVDAFVKSGMHKGSALENGNVVALGDKLDSAGEKDVYEVTTPATSGLDSDIFYMVYEPPMPVVAEKYKGLTDDPREFDIPKDKVFNMFKPQVGDEIIVSEDGLDGSEADYAKPHDGEKDLTFSADTSGVTLAWKNEGETFISIGNERVKAYKLVCVKA